MALRRIPWTGTLALALIIVASTLLSSGPALSAQQTEVLPPAQSLPPHSRVDGLTLSQPERSGPSSAAPQEVKPFLVPDPEGLRRWKKLLEGIPGALPPSQGVVEDRQRNP